MASQQKTQTAQAGKHSCMCCDKLIPATKTICAACAEDMGYSRKAR